MASENAKAVAQEVIATVRNGKIPNKQIIQQKHGYSKSSAKAMKATRTKAYQEEIQPIIDVMIKEREAALAEAKKKRGKANYRDLVDASAKLTKDIQLLSGGKTANDSVNITWDK